MSSSNFDVTIIGGGVIGCLIARELAKYQWKIGLLERHNDTASETTKANSAIVHAGFDAPIGSNKAKFNVEGNAMMEKVCRDLDVRFSGNGSMVLAFDDAQAEALEEMLERGTKNGVEKLSIITGDAARALEPNLSPEIKAVLLAETGGIVSPYKLSHNAAKNAVQNGVTLMLNCPVTAMTKKDDSFLLTTSKGELQSKYIINAAGLFADEVAKMIGDDSFSIYPRKGEYILYDKKLGGTVCHTIFQMPSKLGKGILVTPTVDGNLLIGPNAQNLEDKFDNDSTDLGLDEVLKGAQKSIPCISKRDIITSFTGLRAISSTDDFIIGPSEKDERFINVAGIQSPGLSSAPAIARFVSNLLYELDGGSVPYNQSYTPKLSPVPTVFNLTPSDLTKLVQANPAYGKIVCRCETVSEGEIIQSLRCECGAHALDGVKRRTRAGMGRCQGGFCMPKVLEIIAREKGVRYTDITKNDEGTFILTNPTKGEGRELPC